MSSEIAIWWRFAEVEFLLLSHNQKLAFGDGKNENISKKYD